MGDDLRDRTALVTGATRGLGRCIAQRLAAGGARVAVHGRCRQDAEAVVAEIQVAGGTAMSVVDDLADGPAPERMVAAVAARWGAIDLLVNNAADQSFTPLADPDLRSWRRMLEVNLLAPAALTRIVCQGSNVASVAVVNVASVEAATPFPNHAAYAASKAALVSLTAAAAGEFAPARVNAVVPGLIDRPGLDLDWPAGLAAWQRAVPLARPVRAEEVAAAVAFLASAAASGITGAALPVDAGWTSSPRVSWDQRDV